MRLLHCRRFRNPGDGPQTRRQRTGVRRPGFCHAKLHYGESIVGDYDLLSAVAGKINDQIRAFAGRDQQALQRHRGGQQSQVRSDLVEFLAIRKRQVKESSIGRIENAGSDIFAARLPGKETSCR